MDGRARAHGAPARFQDGPAPASPRPGASPFVLGRSCGRCLYICTPAGREPAVAHKDRERGAAYS